jgi:hypothetical protein
VRLLGVEGAISLVEQHASTLNVENLLRNCRAANRGIASFGAEHALAAVKVDNVAQQTDNPGAQ